MELLPPAEQNSLVRQSPASQQLIAELEARLTQGTEQLLAAKTDLVRESANHRRTEEEFRRSTEQLRELQPSGHTGFGGRRYHFAGSPSSLPPMGRLTALTLFHSGFCRTNTDREISASPT